MLTIFSTVKPFEDRSAVLQRNAITSWTLLDPRPEVILFGDEAGSAEICAELNLRHVPKVARNEFGIPLVPDLFAQAQRLARGDALCYLNSDIVLMSDFMVALDRIRAWCRQRPFLAIGTRWNVWVHDPIDFSGRWEQGLREVVRTEGQPGGPWTMDYFAFPRGFYEHIPPFAVGRPYWDDWMVYGALRARASVVDITPAATVVHQRHDYGHIPGGQRGLYDSQEAHRNRSLAGPAAPDFGLRDATHVLTTQGVQPAWRARGLRQRTTQKLRQRVVLLQQWHPVVHRLIQKGRALHHGIRGNAPIGWAPSGPSRVGPRRGRTKKGRPSADK
jgi:hypothetical protein